MKAQRQKCLQENGGQRDQDGRGNAEAVNLNLFAGCIGKGHVIGEVPEQEAEVRARWQVSQVSQEPWLRRFRVPRVPSCWWKARTLSVCEPGERQRKHPLQAP